MGGGRNKQLRGGRIISWEEEGINQWEEGNEQLGAHRNN